MNGKQECLFPVLGEEYGGTSDIVDAKELVEYIKIINPGSILDIGVGCYGKTGYLVRQYVDHKFRHYRKERIWICGLEAFPNNYEMVKRFHLYNELYCEDALVWLLRNNKGEQRRFDLVVLSHVLEHFNEEDSCRVLSMCYELSDKGLIIAAPNGIYIHEDNENPYQTHKSVWTPQRIADKYPISTPEFSRNNVGVEQFILVVPKAW